MKILFACDLDNTLIHSAKHRKDGDICVEVYDEKQRSFISKRTYELLKEVIKVTTFVPVTTRSIDQFFRITWSDDILPKYAITTNGSILFEGDKPNDEWNNITKAYSSVYMDELKTLLDKLLNEDMFIRCRIVDDRYLFAYFKPEINIEDYKEKYINYTKMNVQFSGRKMYIFPENISKGYAINEFKKRINADFVISAGDSTIDLPMFLNSDISYSINKELIKDIKISDNKKLLCCDEKTIFAEFILEDILKQIKNLNN